MTLVATHIGWDGAWLSDSPKARVVFVKTGRTLIQNDAPKKRAKEDRFGRSKFAKQLAGQLRAWNGSESLVVGLCGPWGSGKTTLCNFIREEVNKRKQKKNHTPMLEFNPWQLSGHSSLTQAFFADLQTLFSGDQEEKKSSLQKMSARLGGGASLVTSLGKLTSLAGVGANLFVPGAGVFVGQAGKALSKTGEVLKSAEELAELDIEFSTQSLAELKSEVNKAMLGLVRPVLVVIDDIDRLSAEEIREVFQLVRVNADFPNLIFLLLFDRDIVAKSLDSIAGGRGNEFLEKIVPALYDVPPVRPKALLDLLGSGLTEILRSCGAESKWLSSRFHQVWTGGLQRYFCTPRDVERFLNGYRVYLAALSENGEPELDPVDMFFVETLRIFDPALYMELEQSESFLLSGRYGSSYHDNDERQEICERRLEEIANCSRFGPSEIGVEMLRDQFPALGRYSGGHEEAYRRRRQLCHEVYFRGYFSRDRNDDEVSVVDTGNLLSYLLGEGSDEFIEACDKRGVVTELLREGRVHLRSLTIGNVTETVGRLALLCDRVRIKKTNQSVFDDSPIQAMRGLLAEILGKIPEDQRFETLFAAYESVPAYALCLEHGWAQNSSGADYFGDEALRLMCLAREKCGCCSR